MCDWQPSQVERYVMSHRITYTLVAESEKWMGSSKHKYWHWLHCSLPAGRHNLTDLKLSHPDVIPIRDRMAAPLRVASWIRFETVMHQQDWIAAIEMLVPNIHLPDEALLRLLCKCVPDQGITSMEEELWQGTGGSQLGTGNLGQGTGGGRELGAGDREPCPV